MKDVQVVDQLETATLPQLETAIEAMADEAKGIFAKYHDGEKGGVNYASISGEDGDRVRELNAKLATARARYEKLQELAGAHDQATKLASYMRQPATSITQPAKKAAPAVTAGQAAFKAWKDSPRKGDQDWSVDLEDITLIVNDEKGIKTVLGTDTGAAGVGSQYPPESVRIGTVVETLYQAHNIAPLIPQVPYGQNAIPYMQETVTAEGAAMTEEGALSPEAQVDWAEVIAPVRKLTVAQPITEELISDEGGMRALVDGRLRQFMGNVEDFQVLRGDGTGQNLTGVLNTAGIGNVNYSLTGATAQGLAEAALSAANLVRKGFQVPGSFIMQVDTWQYISTARDSQDAYLFPQVLVNGADPRLWGLPVRTNENMDGYTVATNIPILVGDWAGAATIFRRQGLTVAVSDSHDDRFTRGVLTIRMAERLGLVVWRANGFATVTRTA